MNNEFHLGEKIRSRFLPYLVFQPHIYLTPPFNVSTGLISRVQAVNYLRKSVEQTARLLYNKITGPHLTLISFSFSIVHHLSAVHDEMSQVNYRLAILHNSGLAHD